MQYIPGFVLIGCLLCLLVLFILQVVLPLLGLTLLSPMGIVVFLVMLVAYYALYNTLVNAVTVVRIAHKINANRPIPNADVDGQVKYTTPHETRLIPPLRYIYTEQPAQPMYAFDAGWFILREVTTRIFEASVQDRDFWYARSNYLLKLPWHDTLRIVLIAISIGLFIIGSLTYILTSVFTLIFLVLYLIAMVVLMGMMLTLMSMVGLVTSLYSTYNRIRYECPSCHQTMVMPIYYCPTCGTPHTRLLPGAFGIFQRRCQCETTLPTFSTLARSTTLEKHCPHCDFDLSAGTGTPHHVVVVGGVSSGKSVFSTVAMDQFMDEYAHNIGMTVSLPDQSDEAEFEAHKNLLRQNRYYKTGAGNDTVRARVFELRRKSQTYPELLYWHDIAGEHIDTQERALHQIFFRLNDVGIVLIVDPFSIPKVKEAALQMLTRKYEQSIRAKTTLTDDVEIKKTATFRAEKKLKELARPSTVQPDQIADNLILSLEGLLNLKPTDTTSIPIAVVVTKCDVLSLENHLGAPKVREVLSSSVAIKSDEEVIDLIVRKFLNAHLPNFVTTIESRFDTVRYFSVATIVHPGGGYDGARTLHPLIWLLDKQGVIPKPLPLLATPIPVPKPYP